MAYGGGAVGAAGGLDALYTGSAPGYRKKRLEPMMKKLGQGARQGGDPGGSPFPVSITPRGGPMQAAVARGTLDSGAYLHAVQALNQARMADQSIGVPGIGGPPGIPGFKAPPLPGGGAPPPGGGGLFGYDPGMAGYFAVQALQQLGLPTAWAAPTSATWDILGGANGVPGETYAGFGPYASGADLTRGTHADNPNSSAYGIFQALTNLHDVGQGYLSGDPLAQFLWGFNYIDDRYGSPWAAWDFKSMWDKPSGPDGYWY